jgi:NAD+--dinitrogen-reductase ADP-D-ribosyltransferase
MTKGKAPLALPVLLSKPACLPFSRCNVPAAILGSLAFQENPVPLVLDGVLELHPGLFARLDATPLAPQRGTLFQDYVTVHFRLEHLEEAGLTVENAGGRQKQRARANYVRMIRGWSFDADSREGAVMKAWVESRFGLTPRYHGEALRDFSAPAYQRYREMHAQGLYGTNALEAQLDLVYTYCQYEFSRQTPDLRHLTLYRGVNRLAEFERLPESPEHSEKRSTLLLNNLNSLTGSRERADEFGDIILTLKVPVVKIFFHCRLLPGILQGEDEFLTIGGLYEAEY